MIFGDFALWHAILRQRVGAELIIAGGEGGG